MIKVNHKKLASASLVYAASRSMMFLLPLVTIPIFSRVLSPVDFGAWMVITSIFTLIISQDFGLCSILRVRLAPLIIAGDTLAIKRHYYSVLLTIIAGALLVSCALLLFRPPVSLIGLLPRHTTAAYLAVIISLISIAGAAPGHAMYAYMESNWVAICDTARASIQLLCSGMILLFAPDILGCTAIFYGPWLLYIFFCYWTFKRRRKWPRIRKSRLKALWIGRRNMLDLIRSGIPFWMLTLISLALGPIDMVLAGKLLGLEQAGNVGLVLKLVNVGYAFVAAVSIGYMGAFGIQYAQKNFGWIARTIRMMVLAMFGVGLVAIAAFMLLGEPVIRIWSGRVVDQPGLYFMAGLVFMTGGINNLTLGVLQGIGKINRVLIPLLVCGGIKIGIACVLIPLWQTNGLMAASAIANSLVAGIVAFEIVRLLRIGQVSARTVPDAAQSGLN